MPPAVASASYWPGWDIVRGVATVPGGSGSLTASGGLVLDGYGGIHPFGGAPPVRGGAYWPGFDIARAIALLPDASGGYELDGFGGVHPFAIGNAPMPREVTQPAYGPGWDIARGITAYANGAGAVLDGYGGLHGFGITVNGSSFTPGSDIARGLASDWNSFWTTYTDTGGVIHTVDSAAGATPSATWTTNMVRDNGLRPSPRSG